MLKLSLLGIASLALAFDLSAAEPARPNILWLTSEDHGPEMGCYGDAYATTPNVDALAAKGMIYTRAWSNAPVCAPSRSVLISGLHAPSAGAEHMRSMVAYPRGQEMFPQLLRAAGYYCTNNQKEDYNLEKPGQVWDESSGKAHYRKRSPGQPFFAVFNSTKSHESQIRTRPHTQVHDPAKAPLPPYHPDTPEIRRDWAQYYDKVTEADADAGKHLRALEEAGLEEDTIIFYFGDHGSGMPRSKRWPYNTGLHVPLVVHFPEKWRHLAPKDYQPGAKCGRLVSFVDFGPTVLSLAGVRPPEWMQGHAFLGVHAVDAPTHLHGYRGRMDERADLVRSITDGRYVYVRNFHPHRIYGQYLEYMFQTPTTPAWRALFEAGKLTPEQSAFWQPKPAEELYDLQNDRHEVRNLAGSAEHQPILQRLRDAQREHLLRTRDLGFLPEGEMHRRAEGSTPYDLGHDLEKYPLERILAVAEAAASRDAGNTAELISQIQDPELAIRYWAAMGLLIRGTEAMKTAREPLLARLDDESPFIRIVAAEALAQHGTSEDLSKALATLEPLLSLQKNSVFIAISALQTAGALGTKASPLADAVASANDYKGPPLGRFAPYVQRLAQDFHEGHR